MDMPIHLAVAACMYQATVSIEERFPKYGSSTVRPLFFVMGCLSLSTASHLLLDWLPHYNFVNAIMSLSCLPYYMRGCWILMKHALLVLPIEIMLLAFPRKRWILLGSAFLGGVYPDIEKVMYLYGVLPRFLVVFRGHSCSYSSAGWELKHKFWLIGAEILIYLVFLWILSHPFRQRIDMGTKLEQRLPSLIRQVFSIIRQSVDELRSDFLEGIHRLSKIFRIVDA